MKLLLSFFLLLIVTVKSNEDSEETSSETALIQVHPCNGSSDITAQFERGLAPDRKNSYIVNIDKEFPENSTITLEFDADAKVVLPNKSFARISTSQSSSIIRFFDITLLTEHKSIRFHVQGVTPGVVPYFKSVKINSKEYCNKSNGPFLDPYIEGYKDRAESPRRVKGNCGRRKVIHTELIENDASTKAGDWPWHAALYKVNDSKMKYICGGSLISNFFVLTAAHCASSKGVQVLPDVLRVILGKFYLIGGDVGLQEKEVQQIILHNGFRLRDLENDIALLKLKAEATFNDYVQPACLWDTNANEELPSTDIYGTIVGWGFDKNNTRSLQLKQTHIPIVSDNTCLEHDSIFLYFLYASFLNDNKFCAGLKDGSLACNGDSGSAFHVFIPDKVKDNNTKAEGAWYIRGITSFTITRADAPSCIPAKYFMFTDVAKYLPWIESKIKIG